MRLFVLLLVFLVPWACSSESESRSGAGGDDAQGGERFGAGGTTPSAGGATAALTGAGGAAGAGGSGGPAAGAGAAAGASGAGGAAAGAGGAAGAGESGGAAGAGGSGGEPLFEPPNTCPTVVNYQLAATQEMGSGATTLFCDHSLCLYARQNPAQFNCANPDENDRSPDCVVTLRGLRANASLDVAQGILTLSTSWTYDAQPYAAGGRCNLGAAVTDPQQTTIFRIEARLHAPNDCPHFTVYDASGKVWAKELTTELGSKSTVLMGLPTCVTASEFYTAPIVWVVSP